MGIGAKMIKIEITFSDIAYKDMQRLIAIARLENNHDLLHSALSLYNWAVNHEIKGHKIIAELKHGYEVVKVIGD
jgi:hypothetical protein